MTVYSYSRKISITNLTVTGFSMKVLKYYLY